MRRRRRRRRRRQRGGMHDEHVAVLFSFFYSPYARVFGSAVCDFFSSAPFPLFPLLIVFFSHTFLTDERRSFASTEPTPRVRQNHLRE